MLWKVLLVTVLPVAIGYVVLYFSVSSQLSRQVNADLDQSYRHFEYIFKAARKMADKNKYLGHASCQEIIHELKREATRELYIRSINLIKNNEIYCSSVFEGTQEYSQLPKDLPEGGILVPGNLLTPNSAVLYLRYGDVMMAIDGRLLLTFLQSSLPGMRMHLVVGDKTLYGSGRVYPADAIAGAVEKHSSEWKFSVRSETVPGAQWAIIYHSYLPVLFIFIIAGFAAGFIFLRQFYSGKLTARDLILAIEQNEIVPWAQPIFDNSGKTLWGIEILARWKNGNGGIIPPDIFIPLAEQSAVILQLTRSLMTTTARELSDNLSSLPSGFHVSFNISNQCCRSNDLVEICDDWLTAVEKRISLTLELTEREQFINSEDVDALMKSLKNIGVKLAVDDFGTAGSNLDYLKHIAFDYIKVDKSYVSGLGSRPENDHIIDNILDLARRMQLEVIAEGIETPEQATILRHKGVNYFQGYLFSAPIPLETFIVKYLRPLL